MSNTITINIQNNCGCCNDGGAGGGGGSGSGGIIDVPFDDLDGDGDGGPPAGFLEATTVDDRQCKVAVFNYSWVYHVTDTLANSATGQAYVTFAGSAVVPDVVKGAVAKILMPAVAAAIAAIATAGIEISDTLTIPIAYTVSDSLISPLTDYISQNNITVALLADIVAKLPDIKDDLICTLATSGDGVTLKNGLERILSDYDGLTLEQEGWVIALAASMAPLLYYTPEWWPGFDTTTLGSITSTCCGDIVPGEVLDPSTASGCQTAHWIIDNLVKALNGIHNHYSGYFWPSPLNPSTTLATTSLESDFQQNAADDLPGNIPRKIISLATSPQSVYQAVGSYIYEAVFLGDTIVADPLAYFDYNWQNLATELTSTKATLVSNLQAALDADDAYSALYTPIDAWITANVQTDRADAMRLAINSIIKPGGQFGLASLMFFQDADVAFYNAVDCGGGAADPAVYAPTANCIFDVAEAVYDFRQSQYNWTIDYVSDGGLAEYVVNSGWKCYRPADNVTTHMHIAQTVRHSVSRVEITANGNVYPGYLRLYKSNDGATWTQIGEAYQPQYNAAFNVCVENEYIKVGWQRVIDPRYYGYIEQVRFVAL